MGEGTAGEGEQRMLLIDGVKYEVWTPPSEDALGESHLPTGDLTALPVGEGRSPVGE